MYHFTVVLGCIGTAVVVVGCTVFVTVHIVYGIAVVANAITVGVLPLIGIVRKLVFAVDYTIAVAINRGIGGPVYQNCR